MDDLHTRKINSFVILKNKKKERLQQRAQYNYSNSVLKKKTLVHEFVDDTSTAYNILFTHNHFNVKFSLARPENALKILSLKLKLLLKISSSKSRTYIDLYHDT